MMLSPATGLARTRPKDAAARLRRVVPGCLTALLFALLALFPGPGAAAPVGTAFSYQGRLTENGSPATGLYDLLFVLYDADTAGTQSGPILTNMETVVSNGLFTTTLDFGGAFDGNARWLEISLRTNGSSDFTVLSPRQNVTAAPYALAAVTLIGPVPDNQLSGNVARVDTVNASIVAATNALFPTLAGLVSLTASNLNASIVAATNGVLSTVSNVVSVSSSNLDASGLVSGIVPNARLTGVSITNGVRYFWDNVAEPYWTYNQFGRATLLDMTGRPLLTLRHNDIGTNNQVIYIGSVASWDAASVQLRGVEDGNPNARFTIVIGSDETYTWRFRETNLNNGADISLLSHDNHGNVILGNTNGAGTVRGTNVVLESVLTTVTNNLAVGGYITSTAGPGLYFGTTNAPTFDAPNGSLYLTSASNGVMYFRTNGDWVIK